jgi:hypothetical protein
VTAVSFHFHGYQPGDLLRWLESDPLRPPSFEERRSPIAHRIGAERIAGRNWTDAILRTYGRLQAVLDRAQETASVDIEPQTLVWLLERDPVAYRQVMRAYERGTAGLAMTVPFHPILPHHHRTERTALFDMMFDFYAPLLRRTADGPISLWLPEAAISGETLADFVEAARRAEGEHEGLSDLVRRVHLVLDARQLVSIPVAGNAWARIGRIDRLAVVARDPALSGEFAFAASEAPAFCDGVGRRGASSLLIASDLESLLANPSQAERFAAIVEALRAHGTSVEIPRPPSGVPSAEVVDFSSWSDYDEYARDGHTSDTRWTGVRRSDGLVVSRIHRGRPISELWKHGLLLATDRIETAVRRSAKQLLHRSGIGRRTEALRRLAVAYGRHVFRAHYRSQGLGSSETDFADAAAGILRGHMDVDKAALIARGYTLLLMGLRSDPPFWDNPDTRVTFQRVALLAQALVDLSTACERAGDSARALRLMRLLRATLLEFSDWHGRGEFGNVQGEKGWEVTEAAWHEALASEVRHRSPADIVRRAALYALQDVDGRDSDEIRAGPEPPVADTGHIVGEAHGDWENKDWCEHRSA